MKTCLYLFILLLLFPFYSISQNNGFIDWLQVYPHCAGGSGKSIVKCSDNSFLVGGSTTITNWPLNPCPINPFDGLIIKFDSIGTELWRKSVGNCNTNTEAASINSILELDSNSFVFCGFDHKGVRDTSVWIAKMNSSGTILWEHHYGSFNGAPWHLLPKGNGLLKTNDGGFLLCGTVAGTGLDVTIAKGEADYWIIKTDSNGILQWQKSFGGSLTDMAASIVSTADSCFLVCGTSYSTDQDLSSPIGGQDIWLIKIDTAGNLIWNKSYGGTSNEEARKIIACKDGGFLIAGFTSSDDNHISNLNGTRDGWLIKIDSSGIIQWEKTIGNLNTSVEINDVIEADTGTFHFTGRLNYNAIFGTVSNSGNVSWFDDLVPLETYAGNAIILDSENVIITGVSRTITPGGYASYVFLSKILTDYNLISGNAYLDMNFNSVMDFNEKGISNHKINELNSGKFKFSQLDGSFNIPLADTGNFVVIPNSLTYYNSVPISHSVNFSTINITIGGKDFAFQPTGTFNDLQIQLSSLSSFRRNRDVTYDIHYKNVGTTVITNPVVKLYPSPYLDYQSASVTPAGQNTDSVYWNLSSLGVFEEGHIRITYRVNADSTTLGSIINSTGRIEPMLSDNTPGNNNSGFEAVVIGSYDPNDIQVNYDTISLADPATRELEYLIRFQNTGNDTAFTVEVTNKLSSLLDFSQFELLSTSHPVAISYNQTDRYLRFQFDNILLPDSNVNEPASHGYIRYKIKPVNGIVSGDSIPEYASIYFDFNSAVVTNTATSHVVQTTGIFEADKSSPVKVYPNPVSDLTHLEVNLTENSPLELFIYNSTGQLVVHQNYGNALPGKHTLEFSTATLKSGMYLVQLKTNSNLYNTKIIK